jgi:hypothetical protein
MSGKSCSPTKRMAPHSFCNIFICIGVMHTTSGPLHE